MDLHGDLTQILELKEKQKAIFENFVNQLSSLESQTRIRKYGEKYQVQWHEIITMYGAEEFIATLQSQNKSEFLFNDLEELVQDDKIIPTQHNGNKKTDPLRHIEHVIIQTLRKATQDKIKIPEKPRGTKSIIKSDNSNDWDKLKLPENKKQICAVFLSTLKAKIKIFNQQKFHAANNFIQMQNQLLPQQK
jgi:hypothetical protein